MGQFQELLPFGLTLNRHAKDNTCAVWQQLSCLWATSDFNRPGPYLSFLQVLVALTKFHVKQLPL
jgi:hypothetical protein